MSADVEAFGRDLNEALDRLIRRAGLPRVQRRLNAAAGVSLDRSSYWLACWLTDAESLRLSDLADVLHSDLSTVSRQVQAAERAGLVERRPDPSDGRASRVYLTAGGRDALERLRAVQRTEILAAIADWLPEDQQRFAELMSRFALSFLAWAVDNFSARRGG
jgi:DNA-binding MarR family transcriptional regulator